MHKKDTDKLIRRLIANAGKIQRARYDDLEELYDLTKTGNYPPDIVELAESFGMMAVKLEAREYKLEQTISELKETSEKLRASKKKLQDYNRTLEEKVRERTAEIQKMASTDDLTQLFNRKEVLSRLRHELSRRASKDISIIFFDIDHFKGFNDNHGHHAGDEVLKKVASTVKDRIRESDIPGRLGGEEFVIVMPDTKASEAYVLAHRIRETLRSGPIRSGRKRLKVTASFGIFSLMENDKYVRSKLRMDGVRRGSKADNDTYRDWLSDLMLKCSDDAMYKAKKSLCLDCGIESEKSEYFEGGICRGCKGGNIDQGRDRVMIFSNGQYMKTPLQ